MKNTLLAAFAMVISSFSFGQDRIIKPIDEDRVLVEITQSEEIIHKGEMVKVGDLFKPNGLWRQYDKKGNITLSIMYLNGRKLWVEKDLGSAQVVINYKGHAI